MNTIAYLVSTGAAHFVPAVSLMPGDVLVEADGYQSEIATVEVDGRHMRGTLKPGMGIVDPKTFRILARAQVLVAVSRPWRCAICSTSFTTEQVQDDEDDGSGNFHSACPQCGAPLRFEG